MMDDNRCMVDTNVLIYSTVHNPSECARRRASRGYSAKSNTVSSLRGLIRRYQVLGKSVHDANIVASILTYGITRLVTYNSSDFRRYEEITIEARLTPDLEEEQ